MRRLALYSLALGSLVSSCLKGIDCFDSVDPVTGEPTRLLDAAPEVKCSWGEAFLFQFASYICMVVYCVLIPIGILRRLLAASKNGEIDSAEFVEAHVSNSASTAAIQSHLRLTRVVSSCAGVDPAQVQTLLLLVRSAVSGVQVRGHCCWRAARLRQR